MARLALSLRSYNGKVTKFLTELHKLQHAFTQLVDKETIIYLIGLYDMRRWNGYYIGDFYQEFKKTALASLQDFNEENQTSESVQKLLMV